MAYSNGFPMTYQPMYPQQYAPQPQFAQQQQQQPQQQAQQNTITWVSGEAGAKAYLVAPNTTVQLWDSESQTIYLKSADASGMPSMKVLDYTIRDNAPAQSAQNVPALTQPQADYVTRDEFNSFAQRVEKHFADVSKKEGKDNGESSI